MIIKQAYRSKRISNLIIPKLKELNPSLYISDMPQVLRSGCILRGYLAVDADKEFKCPFGCELSPVIDGLATLSWDGHDIFTVRFVHVR